MNERDGTAGRLVLVGTPIGNLADLSARTGQILADADTIACEDTRRTRALLSHLGIPAGNRLIAVHEHNEATQVDRILAHLEDGRTVAVVSDAGMPTISDPGARLVRAAIDAGHPVEVVPGPSAVLAALVLSGLDTSRFCFEGFLPRKGGARRAAIGALATERRTVVLFEAPQRVRATVADLADALDGDRPLAVARELTKRFEQVWRGTLAEAGHHLEEAPTRGEYVLVLGGAPPPDGPAEDAIAEALRARLHNGDGRREAVAAVTDALGAPRNVVYEISTRLERPPI